MQIAKIFTLRENSSGPEGSSFSRNLEGLRPGGRPGSRLSRSFTKYRPVKGFRQNSFRSVIGPLTVVASRGDFRGGPFRDCKQNSDSFTRLKTCPRRSGQSAIILDHTVWLLSICSKRERHYSEIAILFSEGQVSAGFAEANGGC